MPATGGEPKQLTWYPAGGPYATRWGYENQVYGVDPNIDVENDVASVLAGEDPQLERAVAEVMKELQGRKVGLPPMPKAPVKVPR